MKTRKVSSLPPAHTKPLIAIDGGNIADDRGGIQRLALDAERFATCGMALAYCNMIIENAREDIVGAMDSGQWRMVERQLRGMLRHACLALQSSEGVHPLPALVSKITRMQCLIRRNC